ncbi:MAG: hypothetical protein ABR501_07975, partial [Pyrinomonadaceae bacterium]
MSIKMIVMALLIALTGFGLVAVTAQQDEDVRGAFLTTRPKTSNKEARPSASTKPSRRRPKMVTASPTIGASASGSVAKSGSATTTAIPAKTIRQRMG